MQRCPPLHTSFPGYVLLQHILSAFTLPINLFAIYCIIYRSTKAMKTYRWHLLWHQILATAVDFLIGVVAIPIYLVPFPLVFPMGLMTWFKFLPTHVGVIVVFLFITWSLAATVQLFIYRYLRVTGRNHFPWHYLLLLIVTYVLCASPSIGFEIIYPRNQLDFLHKLEKNYSCITEELVQTPQIVGYPRDKLGLFVGLPIILLNCFMSIVCSTCIYLTRKFLQGNTISPSTARLERRFLVNLSLQFGGEGRCRLDMIIGVIVAILVMTPIIIVHIPGFAFVYIQVSGTYSFEIVGVICIVTLSMHGALCGLFLIILTPSYRNVILMRKTKITATPSSFDFVSTAPRGDEFRRHSGPPATQQKKTVFVNRTR